MEKSIFRYIWRHSRREQAAILLLVAASLPFYFLALDLPKRIVNQGIQGEGFASPEDTQRFLELYVPFAETVTGEAILLFDGFRFDQRELLLFLSFAFLGFVIINGGFKFVINTQKGRMGERMLRRLRYELTDRILRFPLPYVRRMKPAEAASMVKDEVEPLGGFIGDAFVSPAFLGGQALTALVFIMWQNIWLGLVAAGVVAVQAVLIPRLRVPILRLGRQRQLTSRQLSGRVGEIVDGSVEIHAHDTSNFERADLVSRLGRIFEIRYEIFQRKFFVKFLNNFLAQLTPFFFYAFGGLLAIAGRLDIGALVAVIAAYKDLPGPIKELIDWDQRRNDVQIKYEQVVEQFDAETMLDPSLQDPDADPGKPLTGNLVATSVTLLADGGGPVVDSVSFTIARGEHVAIVGPGGSGRDHLGLLLARLVLPSSGRIKIGGQDLGRLPEAVTGRRIGYVGQDTYLFASSVRDCLLYGLRHRPLLDPPTEQPGPRSHRFDWRRESERAGNPTWNVAADWTDYAAAGASGPDDIDDRLLEILSLVELETDVYHLGLAGTIDAEARPDVVEAILGARAALSERLKEEDAEGLVIRFHPDRYNANATLAENILFGTPRHHAYAPSALAENALMREVLAEEGLTDDVIKMGASIARTMVEIFADLPPGHPFFEQYSFIDSEDLPAFRSIVTKLDKGKVSDLDTAERTALLRLPFDYVEARHRLGLLDEALQARIVAARKRFAERLEHSDPDAVAFYDPQTYNAAASLQDNILFGRIAHGQAKASETVSRVMTECLDSLGLRRIVIEAGLNFAVGIGGNRLSPVQRQKIGLARALIKRPDLLVVNDALAIMDLATQSRLLDRVLEHRHGRRTVWVLQRPEVCEHFDRVLVMADGRLVEQGSFSDLSKPGSALSDILAAE